MLIPLWNRFVYSTVKVGVVREDYVASIIPQETLIVPV